VESVLGFFSTQVVITLLKLLFSRQGDEKNADEQKAHNSHTPVESHHAGKATQYPRKRQDGGSRSKGGAGACLCGGVSLNEKDESRFGETAKQ
jgi:hypothetical protein